MTADRAYKILLAEPDPELVDVLVSALAHRLDAQVTCVSTIEACLEVELLNPHELVVAATELNDGSGLQLARQLSALSPRPIILMGEDPSRDEVLEALHLGVREFAVKPFPVLEFLDAAERVLHGFRVRRQHQARFHSMRELVRRVIRERRELDRRMQLICRDLVGAHRRLVQRVLEREQACTPQSP